MQRIIFENSIKHLNVEILDCNVTADILLASEAKIAQRDKTPGLLGAPI